MWDQLAAGALGAVVVVDTRRLAESFSAIDYFESRGLPFVIAVNRFDGATVPPVGEVRVALDVDPDVAILEVDARDPYQVEKTLRDMLDIVLFRARATG